MARLGRGMALIAVAALALAGCGDDGAATGADGAPTDGGATTDGGADSGAAIPGGGLTVEEALTTDVEAGTPITVHGFLIDEAGDARMCAAAMESYPPQCGQPSFPVEGVDVAGRDGAVVEGDIAWVDDAQLTGTFEGDVFVVTDTAT